MAAQAASPFIQGPRPQPRGTFGELFAFQRIECRQRGRCRKWVAAECGTVASGGQWGQMRGKANGSQRHPIGDALRQRDDVGAHANVLEGKPGARPPEAGLHFVENEQRATRIAKLAQGVQIVVIGGVNTPFALYRFQNDGGGLFGDGGFGSGAIAKGNMADIGHQRLEGGAILGGCSGRKGAHGAPVKRAVHGDDASPPSEQTGGFERTFHGFGAAVAEEEAGETADTVQTFQQGSTHVVRECTRAGNQACGLFAEGCAHSGVGMPQNGSTMPGDAVDVLAPLGVPHTRSFAPYQRQAAQGVSATPKAFFHIEK